MHRGVPFVVLVVCVWSGTVVHAAPVKPVNLRAPQVTLDDGTTYLRQRLVAALIERHSPRVSPPGEAPREPSQPLVLIFEDGRVLWRTEGSQATTWHSGTVTQAALQQLAATTEKLDAEAKAQLLTSRLGPDASYTQLFLRLKDRHAALLESWHRGLGPETIATANGLAAREGRDPAAVLAAQPAEYRAFRRAWQTLEDALWALTTTTTKRSEVTATFSWDWVQYEPAEVTR